MANLGKHLLPQLRPRTRVVGTNHLFKLGVAKGITACRFGLSHAIGIEQKPVARF